MQPCVRVSIPWTRMVRGRSGRILGFCVMRAWKRRDGPVCQKTAGY